MLSRALSLATVTLLAGCFAAIPVQAQNLEAGKSPSQIFAGTCSLCHKSSRGLLKTVPPGSLPGFLREHYTTSNDMASVLSAYLISNGANDTRYVGSQPKQGNDAKTVANPDTDALSPQTGREGRNAKRTGRPGEVPDVAKPAVDAQTPLQNAGERDADGRKLPKQKLSKRSKPEESPKIDAGAKTEPSKDEPSKAEAAKDDQPKSEASKDEGLKTESTKPSGEGNSEAAKIDAPKETGGASALRADPAPPVVSTGAPDPAAAPSAPAAAQSASAPQPAPVVPAGPPVPPISQ
jgi:hypothetical protein